MKLSEQLKSKDIHEIEGIRFQRDDTFAYDLDLMPMQGERAYIVTSEKHIGASISIYNDDSVILYTPRSFTDIVLTDMAHLEGLLRQETL